MWQSQILDVFGFVFLRGRRGSAMEFLRSQNSEGKWIVCLRHVGPASAAPPSVFPLIWKTVTDILFVRKLKKNGTSFTYDSQAVACNSDISSVLESCFHMPRYTFLKPTSFCVPQLILLTPLTTFPLIFGKAAGVTAFPYLPYLIN